MQPSNAQIEDPSRVRPLLSAVAEIISREEQPPPYDQAFRWGPLSSTSPDPAWHISQKEYDALCTFEDCRQALKSACALLEARSDQARHNSTQLSQAQFDLSTSQARLVEHDHLAHIFSFQRSQKKCARKGIIWDKQSALAKSQQHADLARRERGRSTKLGAACIQLRAAFEASHSLLEEACTTFRQAEVAFQHAQDQVSPQLRWDAVGLGLLPKSCMG